MKFTNFGINTASGEVVGALPQFIQGAPLAVRDRSVAPDFVPTTGEVRPLSLPPISRSTRPFRGTLRATHESVPGVRRIEV